MNFNGILLNFEGILRLPKAESHFVLAVHIELRLQVSVVNLWPTRPVLVGEQRLRDYAHKALPLAGQGEVEASSGPFLNQSPLGSQVSKVSPSIKPKTTKNRPNHV